MVAARELAGNPTPRVLIGGLGMSFTLGAALDAPEDFVFDMFQQAAFPGQAIGRPILGTVESIKGMSRDTVNGYYRDRYRPENLVVAAAGNEGKAEKRYPAAYPSVVGVGAPQVLPPSFDSQPYWNPASVRAHEKSEPSARSTTANERCPGARSRMRPTTGIGRREVTAS